MAPGIIVDKLAALAFANTACYLGSCCATTTIRAGMYCTVVEVRCCSHVINCLSTGSCSYILGHTAEWKDRSSMIAAGEYRITVAAEAYQTNTRVCFRTQ